MKSNYKVALVLVVVVCGVIVTYYGVFPGQSREAGPKIAMPADTRQAARPGTGLDSPPIVVHDRSTRARNKTKDHAAKLNHATTKVLRDHKPQPDRAVDQPGVSSLRSRNGQSTRAERTSNDPEVKKDAPPTLTFGRTPQRPNVSHRSAVTSNAHKPARASGAIVTASKAADDAKARSGISDTPSDKPTPARSGRTYTIATGDTFRSIAVHLFGSERYWFEISMANPDLDPKGLAVGQVIKLPDISKIRQDQDRQPRRATGPSEVRQHVVRPGEALYVIAQRYYNNPESWRLIYDANRDRIGTDPDHVRVGMVLKIPPNHTSP